MLKDKFIGFIGGGAIAEALIGGIIKADLVPAQQIIVADVSNERLKYLHDKYQILTEETAVVAAKVDMLFLTVKPQVINEVLNSICEHVQPATVVVSVVAGVTLDTLEAKLAYIPVVRVMPNTPVAVGAGMSAVALGTNADEAAGQMVEKIFGSAGLVVRLPENALDAVTGLSGSGPGYGYVIIDALADAGVRVGLSRHVAITLAAQTMMGAAKMVLETGQHPAKLRDMVTSPGGTTIAGIHVMEQQGIRAALIDAVVAATNRSQEMGRK